MIRFAERLKERSKALGISNAEAAKLCGLDTRRYGHYISGRSRPNYENLVKIAIALNTSPNILLGFDEGERSLLIEQLTEVCKSLSDDQIKMLISFADSASKK
ncbi:helix-turn-helix domain-containing protein [Asticcacaulis sp. AND118]|uniref:helix-turn-helix domain-containing protein n=1 Tax=Asticcacaulis sp. AND118 TaxID=2840468 RepID=UPI001CFFEC77|nr:helix-turn-helix transcriptional regulator [Asticcacaulis sp. AND118]UDF05622.1 helix-turn-helix domain-containing protein [Asticcacaulis sp. AND118]